MSDDERFERRVKEHKTQRFIASALFYAVLLNKQEWSTNTSPHEDGYINPDLIAERATTYADALLKRLKTK